MSKQLVYVCKTDCVCYDGAIGMLNLQSSDGGIILPNGTGLKPGVKRNFGHGMLWVISPKNAKHTPYESYIDLKARLLPIGQ